jgi:hypothetical protein
MGYALLSMYYCDYVSLTLCTWPRQTCTDWLLPISACLVEQTQLVPCACDVVSLPRRLLLYLQLIHACAQDAYPDRTVHVAYICSVEMVGPSLALGMDL